MAKVAVIVTILNEEKTLPALFAALERQSLLPDQVIISDGGSTDGSQSLLKNWHPKFEYKYIVRPGNRSIGRNAAIESTNCELIAITDAGCVPEKKWLEMLVNTIEDERADVVAGYYKAKSRNAFEEAASAYMLVMPENVDANNFLPATRSMMILRRVWSRAGKFPIKFSHNEDYVFAKKLQSINAKFSFSREAVVLWSPPLTWNQFLKQIGRFAYGDTNAGIIRPKVISLYLRWLLFIGSMVLNFWVGCFLLALYSIWAILKNSKHVHHIEKIWILPGMQISSDIIVMIFSILGMLNQTHEIKN